MPDPVAPAVDTPEPGDTPDGAEDLTQGYCIEISVLPDGSYKVSGPEPLPEEADEEKGEPGAEQGDDYPSIGAALKGVLDIVKQNPVGGDADKQFGAGYAQG